MPFDLGRRYRYRGLVLTPVEVISALTRRLREKSLKPMEFKGAKEQLAALERAWSEVIPMEQVRERHAGCLKLIRFAQLIPYNSVLPCYLRGDSSRLPLCHSGSAVGRCRRKRRVSGYRSLTVLVLLSVRSLLLTPLKTDFRLFVIG